MLQKTTDKMKICFANPLQTLETEHINEINDKLWEIFKWKWIQRQFHKCATWQCPVLTESKVYALKNGRIIIFS